MGAQTICHHCGSDRLDLERIDLATWMVPCLACKGWTRYRFAWEDGDDRRWDARDEARGRSFLQDVE